MVESDDLRNVRKSMPPRRRDDGVSTFEPSKYEDAMFPLPMVRSRPFLVPPLYPPAAVGCLFELDALLGARWKYLQKFAISKHNHRQKFSSGNSGGERT